MKTLNHYLRAQPHHTLWLWLSAGLLLAVSACFGVLAYQQHRVVAQATLRNDKLLAMQAATIVPTASRSEQEEQKRWAQLKIERDFPWSPVFQAVERASNPDIELLEFKPDKLNRRITLGGEARSRQALIVYLDALAAQAGLNNVYLTHQQTVERGTLETISFEIKAGLG
jgi:hypothetical protein